MKIRYFRRMDLWEHCIENTPFYLQSYVRCTRTCNDPSTQLINYYFVVKNVCWIVDLEIIINHNMLYILNRLKKILTIVKKRKKKG